jgi:hypothetical protein
MVDAGEVTGHDERQLLPKVDVTVTHPAKVYDSAAGRLARSGRLRLRLTERWPWAVDITVAVTRLQALPGG